LKSLTFILFFLHACGSFAQTVFNMPTLSTFTAVDSASQDDGVASKMIHLAYYKPIQLADFSGSLSVDCFSATNKYMENTTGFNLGYTNAIAQDFGWISNFNYIKVLSQGYEIYMLRLDENLGYALTNFVALKGGVNFSKLTAGTGWDDANPGLGYQESVSIQLSENFAVDVGYIQMTQIGNSDGSLATAVESGPQLAFSGTF
jgi:hypothetical protein